MPRKNSLPGALSLATHSMCGQGNGEKLFLAVGSRSFIRPSHVPWRRLCVRFCLLVSVPRGRKIIHPSAIQLKKYVLHKNPSKQIRVLSEHVRVLLLPTGTTYRYGFVELSTYWILLLRKMTQPNATLCIQYVKNTFMRRERHVELQTRVDVAKS